MSIGQTFLGPLESGPRHGYDLKRTYDERFATSRPLAYGQVYATLSRLLKHGLVAMDGVEAGGGPDRKRYAITEAGVADVDILIGASLLVDVIEQLRERRRLLVAFGARRGTIGWSLLWQAAVPVALGIGSATVVGLGALLLRIADEEVRVDVTGVLAMAGAGAALVLLATAASLPALSRSMRADGLRTE